MTNRKAMREEMEAWERENTLAPNEERIRARDIAREEGEPRFHEARLEQIRMLLDNVGRAYGSAGSLYVADGLLLLTDEEREAVDLVFNLADRLDRAASWLARETGAIPSEDF